MARLLSGRVGVTSYAGLSTDRQQTNGFPSFHSLEETEPNLGLPSNNDFVLHGDVNGRRFWAAGSGAASGSVDGITVQDQSVTSTGFAGSITTLNFIGNGVTIEDTKVSAGAGIEVGVSTITINKANLNIQDSSGFTPVTGVTTVRVGSGLSFVEIPQGQFSSGIVSFFSNADSKTDFQDDRGNDSFQDVTVIRVGAGLTITQPAVGIASIKPTGDLEFLNVSGIASAPIFDGNLQGNVTGNITGNVTGNLTGDSAGTHTGGVVGDVTGNVTGMVNSGLSTITQLQASTINATGIITTASGFSAPAGSFGFSGDLNSAGVSTVAFFSGTNIKISGIGTADGGFVAPASSQGFVGKLVGDHTGNINSTGVSTITTLSGTTATYTSFVGSLTGSSSLVDIAAETVDTDCSIMFATNPSGSQAVKSSASLTFDSNAGILTATGFSGDGSRLTSLDASQLSGTLPNLDGSSLNNIVSSSVDITATNTTSADHFILFADSATGVEAVRSDTDLLYNPGTNTLTASLFNGSCTGLTGNPNISVTEVTLKGNLLPDTDAVRDLGSSTLRFQNVYTADMHFNNEGINNSIDGTWGHWTLQEGDENIFMINQRTGKKYKINLTEV
jgi:hypothetical protein